MPLTSLQLHNFTAFAELDLTFSPGVNILVGENGTGKTHVMKVCYAACEASKPGALPFHEKLVNVFLPSKGQRMRLMNAKARREWPRNASSRPFARGCGVFNVASWNKCFPDHPVTRIEPTDAP